MGFVEKSAVLTAGNKDSFFINNGFAKFFSDSSPKPGWLCPGEQKNIGIRYSTAMTNASTSNADKSLVIGFSSNLSKYTPLQVITIANDIFDTEGKSYIQQSADKKVIYFRSALHGDPQKRTNFIFAEQEDGRWGLIVDTDLYDYTYGKYQQTISDPAVESIPNSEFTAVKMRNPETGVNFTSLYRVLSAPTFTPAGMYIDFGGTPMRAATVQTASDTEAKICFAFPVA